MNQSNIAGAIETLLGVIFEASEMSQSKWLEKPGPNGSILRIIMDTDHGHLDFSWGFDAAVENYELRFHLEGATVFPFGETLRLVESSGSTLHLSHKEGRTALFAWLPPDR